MLYSSFSYSTFQPKFVLAAPPLKQSQLTWNFNMEGGRMDSICTPAFLFGSLDLWSKVTTWHPSPQKTSGHLVATAVMPSPYLSGRGWWFLWVPTCYLRQNIHRLGWWVPWRQVNISQSGADEFCDAKSISLSQGLMSSVMPIQYFSVRGWWVLW